MTDSIQAQLAAARRRQILDAATAAFAAKGFHPTTIRDVAKRAGVADGTIYNYFENKTALLFGVLDRLHQAALAEVDLDWLATAAPAAYLRAYIAHPLLQLQENNFDLFRVVMSEVMVNPALRERYYQLMFAPMQREMEARFRAWQRAGNMRPVDVPLAVRAVSALIVGLIMQYTMGDETLRTQWDEVPDAAVDLLLSGLGAAP